MQGIYDICCSIYAYMQGIYGHICVYARAYMVIYAYMQGIYAYMEPGKHIYRPYIYVFHVYMCVFVQVACWIYANECNLMQMYAPLHINAPPNEGESPSTLCSKVNPDPWHKGWSGLVPMVGLIICTVLGYCALIYSVKNACKSCFLGRKRLILLSEKY